MMDKKLLANITDEEAQQFTSFWAQEETIRFTLDELVQKRTKVFENKQHFMDELQKKYNLPNDKYHFNTRDKAIYEGHL